MLLLRNILKGWKNGMEPPRNCSMCEIFIFLRNVILSVKIGNNRLNVQNFTYFPALHNNIMLFNQL